MHYATHKNISAEVIYKRVDSTKKNIVMTNFKGDYITKPDIGIAKNYLTEKELNILNLLVSQFLDYAELQALEMNPMTMEDWSSELDRHLEMNGREILSEKGTISRKMAIEKAEMEFYKYRDIEMRELESGFDKTIRHLKE